MGQPLRAIFLLPSLAGGGAERSVLGLVSGLARRGIAVELVLGRAAGVYLEQVPSEVRVVDLGVSHLRSAVVPLARHLRRSRPDVLVSHLTHVNLVAVVARALSRTRTRLVLVEHQTPSARRSDLRRARLQRPLARWLHPRAEAIVAVSRGAARDVEVAYDLPSGSVRVIPNPVVDDALLDAAKAAPEHPWLRDAALPCFLAAGRLVPQKDFATLLRAFAALRRRRRARLVVLGEGGERGALESLAADLGVADDVSLPGFVENPYAFMSRAACFVLSSRWEALPTVLIEALACGSPVVSTRCPTGPDEILEAGRYGALVPVGDVDALAAAMERALDGGAAGAEARAERGRFFSHARAIEGYRELLTGGPPTAARPLRDASAGENVTVRPLGKGDVREVASVHLDAFEGFFLSFLGPRFLRQYYQGIVELSTYCVVAESGGRIVGFAVGVDAASGFHRRLLRRRGLRLLLAALPAAATSAVALRRIARAPGRRSPGEADAVPGLHLASIAVHPAHRGEGIGGRLLEALELRARTAGLTRVILETDADDNAHALDFYARCGYAIRATHATPEGRRMHELAKAL